MTDPTHEEIERLIAIMRASERASAAGAAVASVFYWLGKVTCTLHALLADRERLERERDNLRVLAETVCAFIDGEGRAVDTEKAGEAIRALRYALAGLASRETPR